jgi:hypothetical protein
MGKTALAILAFLVLGGCADSAKDVEPAISKSPTAEEMSVTAQELAAQPVTIESVFDTKMADSSVDAAALLAFTLELAKAADKRVIVHLGAPW